MTREDGREFTLEDVIDVLSVCIDCGALVVNKRKEAHERFHVELRHAAEGGA